MSTVETTPAQIIATQMGGTRRLSIMVNAKHFTSDNEGNTLMFRFSGSKVANHVTISLNSMDTYDIVFKKIRGAAVKEVESLSGIYNDNLVECFERVTGLYLTF